jgi:hypothetical protein
MQRSVQGRCRRLSVRQGLLRLRRSGLCSNVPPSVSAASSHQARCVDALHPGVPELLLLSLWLVALRWRSRVRALAI